LELEFGLDTFGDVTADAGGHRLPYAQVIRNTVEQAVLADRVGVGAFGLGEHHRDDFAVSAPEIVLAAVAARTERIKLHVGSPETVARKIAKTVQALGIQRFDLKYSNGTLPHERMMTAIRLYGEQVIPRVRELLAG
jgi:alkanesulfonate monooxygenase SsuD/methylene tetrahydromethanopterin reductase-like flavin-dependent oxidoreductase (luciferase family)